jgi:3-hydroxy-9,10-secoandrosta-1,3,5(10)-triene-9,17-dione monooxygenase reductase component
MNQQFKNNDEIRSFRGALGQFPTGVAVVTALTEDLEPVGMTINSFNSVSLAPALVSWCIDHKAASYRSFASAKNFAVTLLSEDQSEIAKRFATRGANKFQGIKTGPDDTPIIPNGCAWFKCETSHSISLGDHTMLVGKVIDFAKNPLQPLVFKGGQFLQLAEVVTRAAA